MLIYLYLYLCNILFKLWKINVKYYYYCIYARKCPIPCFSIHTAILSGCGCVLFKSTWLTNWVTGFKLWIRFLNDLYTGGKQYSTRNELWKAKLDVYQGVGKDVIKTLTGSMDSRLENLFQCSGNYIGH